MTIQEASERGATMRSSSSSETFVPIVETNAGLLEPPGDVTFCMLRGSSVAEGSLQNYVVMANPFRIGRRPDNHLCLGNPTVSGYHAQIVREGSQLRIEDLGSTNGTFLNGKRVDATAAIEHQDLLQFGSARFEVLLHAEAAGGATMTADVAQQVLADLQFLRLLTDPAVEPYYQPIVRLDDGRREGYEVLARSRLTGLETPAKMFRVALERRKEVELSELLRHEGIERGRSVGEGVHLYLNTHPSELVRPGLVASLEALRRAFPGPAIILEIHEAAITSPELLQELRPRLIDLNMGLAYDDFGAGQARLLELTVAPPDVIKFDMGLVQGLDRASWARQRMVRSLVDMVRGLGVVALAEGVETAGEVAACREMGFELAQGYFFGRPAPASRWLSSGAEVAR